MDYTLILVNPLLIITFILKAQMINSKTMLVRQISQEMLQTKDYNIFIKFNVISQYNYVIMSII